MPLSWNEIKDRALAFSRKWEDEESEDAEAKSFWDDFFNVFGISRRRVASFEEPVRKLGNQFGYIDLFWKGVLLVEHKSRGKDLDKAYTQALDYFPGITERELPKYVLVSDFARIRLYDLEGDRDWEFKLKDLYKRIKLFGFIAGYQTQVIKEQDPVNVKAAEQMGKLHDLLKASGYDGHPLEVYLVRLLFCLFADDTTIFNQRGLFQDYLENRTSTDGSDLGQHLAALFQILNTPEEKRQKTLDEQLAVFPYVNGKLFEETLPLASFDANMRQTLLDCTLLDWGRISPAVFGALFQSVMDPKLRRNLGAHYTSEKNILKLIKPLFLDELWEEFHRVKSNKNKLFEFSKKLTTLAFLDPACGCGNFLVIAYRELRLLELEILRTVRNSGQLHLDVFQLVQVNVDQFYGIELEEFPAQIAQVAMWLMDHQMNMLVSEEFGLYFARLPLKKSAEIVNGDALDLRWEDIIAKEKVTFILGNPPYLGHHLQSKKQKTQLREVLQGIEAAGVLDFVSAWYFKACQFITGTTVKAAFVSTNSITQGEQVGILWSRLFATFGIRINFAHRTFRWSNEGRGVAGVYCVIVGFQSGEPIKRMIFDYETPSDEPHLVPAKNINAYLVDAPDTFLSNRNTPICAIPGMMYGNKPTDGGHYLLTNEEKLDLLKAEPNAGKFIRPFISAKEFLNGEKRWCIWLVGAKPQEIKNIPAIMGRVELVEQFRKLSKAPTTRNYPYPTLFRQVTQPEEDFVLVPGHTSENRRYIPMGFFDREKIVGNSCFAVPGAKLHHFGVMMSAMHMAWVRYTCGRLEGRYRYSKDIVYNNFPWPSGLDTKQIQAIEAAARSVLEARAQFPKSSLADLYDPLTMPPALTKAHQALDKAVDAAYLSVTGRKPFTSDAERVAFLFELYQQYTSLLPTEKSSGQKKRTKKGA